VVSELEAQLRGAPGRLATTLPLPQQSLPDRPAGLSDQVIAPSEPTATSKPALLPGNIAEATRPFWQGVPGTSTRLYLCCCCPIRQICPLPTSSLLSTGCGTSERTWLDIRLDQPVAAPSIYQYTAEATLKMLVDMLRNMQR